MICFAQASTSDQLVKTAVAKCLGIIGLKSFEDNVVLYSAKDNHIPYAKVLVQIWQDCGDPDPVVQSTALECLTSALQCDFAHGILHNMESVDIFSQVAKYLQLFRSTKKLGKRLETGDPSQLLNDRSMWSCDRGTYRDWLCGNTWKLIKCCRDEHIRCMEDISRLSSHLCENLFPMLFHQLAKSSSKTGALMGNCLSTAFKSALAIDDGNVSEDFLHLLLRVVQYNREQTTNNSEQSHVETRRSPKKEVASSNPIKVNYLLAAKVANKCKRPFMSVLFVELWIDELEAAMEKEIESSGTSKERKSTSRALSFSHDPTTEHKEHSSELKKNQQVIQNRCQGLKSPMTTLQTSESGLEAKSVLISSYDLIGDLDGLNGCYSSCPLDPVKDRALIHIREKEGRWNDALNMHDLALTSEAASNSYKSNMVECLQQSGLEHLCDVYMRNLEVSGPSGNRPNTDQHLRDVQYKAAWQACQWDESILNIQEDAATTSKSFHQHLYQCMSSGFDDESKNFNIFMNEARNATVSEFCTRHINHVVAYDFHTVSSRLQCLKEIEDAQQCLTGLTSAGDFSQSWTTYDDKDSRAYRFDDVNLVLAVRSSILRSVNNRQNKKQNEDHLETWLRHLLVTLRVCCEHDRLQNAHKVLRHLSDVTSRLPSDSVPGTTWSFRVKLEGAKLLWIQKEVSFALASLQSILGQLESTIDLRHTTNDVTSLQLMLAETLQTYGGWLHESKYEGPSVIMGDYLEKSVSVVDKVYKAVSKTGSSMLETKRDSLRLLVKNYHMLAKFADEQYLQVIKYKKSSEYAQKRVLASAPKQELESMQQSGQAPARKTMVIVDKNLNIDKQELTRIEEKAREFLSSALRSYIQCLQLSDQHDILMYRICALWLENPSQSSTNSLMSSEHGNIPSHKFIPLSYQLAARLNVTTGDFQTTLRQILHRVTVDHPYHVLNVILALVNAKKDEEFASSAALPTSKRKSKKSSSNKANMSARITAATSLLTKIRQRHSTLVQHTEYVANAYIEFANFDVSDWKSRQNVKVEIPGHVIVAKFASSSKLCPVIQDVVIPISRIPVQKDGNYADKNGLVTYRYLKPYFETVGGVNLPKVMVAVGSDGVMRRHLVKGKDDLRQDAVMQQVFETVNSLLRKDHDTTGLRIRTYRVTPLSQRSGLVEWCGGTTPIGVYLVGNAQQIGAHHRYRPGDTSVIKCRKMIAGVANQTQLVKLQKYREICSSLHPVFRHFFTERFLDPAEWYSKRRAYTRSVAASSIVGYVLGLGDRHVQNILVDYVTAELIHIDLGVAFEQGKCLPTPETVPFRLTRDIVDGMGATGVEGVFRRCCERTMQAMRSSYDVITTIVEVLLYDPLHEWTLTPSKAMHIQRQPTDNTESISINTSMSTLNTTGDFMSRIDEQGCEQLNTNKLAERVLLRLQEKLRGHEEGSVLSICGQVNMLIQQATDPSRLCQLFAGWQPYL
uniref:non-specific serine/threonine protein kinase n=1 Tax=Phallusia mammillata TaxID=59560 RepID=A0A6F9D7N6_9ASCI|nr:serine-protein kinase ATM-like [Phallusia mammillata]